MCMVKTETLVKTGSNHVHKYFGGDFELRNVAIAQYIRKSGRIMHETMAKIYIPALFTIIVAWG